MKYKHTPGPWHYDPEHAQVLHQNGDDEKYRFSGNTIACIENGGESDDQDDANGYLIAQAPEMREMLDDVLPLLDGIARDEINDDETRLAAWDAAANTRNIMLLSERDVSEIENKLGREVRAFARQMVHGQFRGTLAAARIVVENIRDDPTDAVHGLLREIKCEKKDAIVIVEAYAAACAEGKGAEIISFRPKEPT